MNAKFYLAMLLIAILGTNVSGQVPDWAWAVSASGTQYDQASTVTADGSGNIYVAGYFSSDSIIFDSYTLHNNGIEFEDIFIAKYNSTGNLLWAKSAGGSMDDKPFSVTTDDIGNVYLTGYFYSPNIVFGNDTLKNAGNVGDIFIVKYDTNGNILWSKREGGPGLEIPYAIKIDYNNNIIVTGRFSSLSVSFGEFNLLQKGSMDIFLVKYDSDGKVLWARGAGGTGNDESYCLDIDNSG